MCRDEGRGGAGRGGEGWSGRRSIRNEGTTPALGEAAARGEGLRRGEGKGEGQKTVQINTAARGSQLPSPANTLAVRVLYAGPLNHSSNCY